MNPSNRVALVTGASSGIGRATATYLARRGAVVVAVARRKQRLEELTSAMTTSSPTSCFIAGDLAEPNFTQSLVPEVLSRYGRLDILVNNAATPKHKSIFDVKPDEIERTMRVNFLSAASICLAALSPMRAQGGGVIVNVSSFAARVVPPRESIYAASKGALSSFTEGLWSDLRGSGIHAGLVTPGPIDTEIWKKLDQPSAFRGRLYPVSSVVDAIFEVIEQHRFEIQVPRVAAALWTARFLRSVFPALLRRGMSRFEPVPNRDRDL